MTFSPEEKIQYHRQMLLPEIGVDGQRKLKNAKVLVIGIGGLGSAACWYLAAAGVGTLGMIDDDVVDGSNLQRQIVHSWNDIGRYKVDSAKEKLSALNPFMTIKSSTHRLTGGNVLSAMEEYDIVVDGTDNFSSRYLINDACVLLKKTFVFGSVYRFEGHITIFGAKDGPCYRCLHPTPPPESIVANCAEAGVLGVVPGIIGCMQASEVIKMLLSVGRPLIGRLQILNALSHEWQEFKISKNRDCPICGDNPSITSVHEIHEVCTVNDSDAITPDALKTKISQKELIQILDVLTDDEYDKEHIGGIHIPLDQLTRRLGELRKHQETIVYCLSGRRSTSAVNILKSAGFNRVQNLQGGLNAWKEKGFHVRSRISATKGS